MVRDLRRLADTRSTCWSSAPAVYGAAIGLGRRPARAQRRADRPRRLRRRHLVQQPEDPARRPAVAAGAEPAADAAVHPRAAGAGPHRPAPGAAAAVRHPDHGTASTRQPRWCMRVALALNDMVARDRNDGIVDPALRLPAGRHRLEGRGAAAEPARRSGRRHRRRRLARLPDGQRRSRDVLVRAARRPPRGATAANYVEAESLLVEHGRVTGARVSDDAETGERVRRAGARWS